jgi:hypothetical protein
MSKDNWQVLLNNMYRTLLKNGRTYAAFNKNDIIPIINDLNKKGIKEIFDPMSGYGASVQWCEGKGISTYNIELNTPAYFWQILNNPKYKNLFIKAIENINSTISDLISANIRSEASDNWFTERGKEIVLNLYNFNKKNFDKITDTDSVELLSLALLLPFVSRLSCSTNGDVAHIKKGGLCVYLDYIEHYKLFLNELVRNRINKINNGKKNLTSHEVILGDCAQISMHGKKFNCMLTSPPYPNSRDYAKMFNPENYILDWLYENSIIKFKSPDSITIGSNVVSGRITGQVTSSIAKDFLDKIQSYKGTKKAMSDNRSYYYPYFKNYFSDIEKAYSNVSLLLDDKFEGYIVVTNNTARNFVIPVAESIIDIWRRLGFQAEIYKNIEKSHMGAKNPDAKGFKAKHMEYIIKVHR